MGNLRFRDVPPAGAGVPGGVSFGLAVTNVGRRTCELAVTGDQLPAQVRSRAGGVIAVATPNDAVAVAPPPGLGPGATAITTITWVSWCGAPVPGWQAEVLTSGSDGYTTVPRPASLGTASCRRAASNGNQTVAAPAWLVLNRYGQPLADPVRALRARIDQRQLAGKPGGWLAYTVTISNPRAGPVTLPLGPCPSSVSVMDSRGAELLIGARYLLNCRAMPKVLQAGATVRLAARARLGSVGMGIPGSGPTRNAVYWSVPDWQLETTAVELRIT